MLQVLTVTSVSLTSVLPTLKLIQIRIITRQWGDYCTSIIKIWKSLVDWNIILIVYYNIWKKNSEETENNDKKWRGKILSMHQYHLKIILAEYYGLLNSSAKVQENDGERAHFKNFLVYMYVGSNLLNHL